MVVLEPINNIIKFLPSSSIQQVKQRPLKKQLNNDTWDKSPEHDIISFTGYRKNKKTVVAMAPLYINPKNKKEWKSFERSLTHAKQKGIQGISVDVWWGMTEKSDQKFDWDYYDKMFSTIKKHDLKIVPILSFHKCGGNVGDDVNINVPEWSWDYLGEKAGKQTGVSHDKLKQELEYKNEQGKYSDDAIPVWYDKAMLPQYKEFMQEFDNHFIKSKGYGNDFIEINVSLGPSGELRFPAYGSDALGSNAPYPNSGNFVGFDKGGQNDFKAFIKNKYKDNIDLLNREWGTDYNSFSNIKMKAPKKLYERYSIDFVDWYNGSLLKHEKNIMNLSHDVFAKSKGKFALGFKIPGIHWNMGREKIGICTPKAPTPRITEIKTGLISIGQDYNNKSTDYGYNRLLDVTKEIKEAHSGRDTVLHFTCLEMDNNPNEGNSRAKDLVSLILNGAKKRDLTIKGENALGFDLNGSQSWQNIRDGFDKNYKGDKNHIGHKGNSYDGINFLRVNNIVGKDKIGYFQRFIDQIKQKPTKENN